MFLRLLIFHSHFFSQIFCQHCIGITPIGFLLLLFFLNLQLPIFSLPFFLALRYKFSFGVTLKSLSCDTALQGF